MHTKAYIIREEERGREKHLSDNEKQKKEKELGGWESWINNKANEMRTLKKKRKKLKLRYLHWFYIYSKEKFQRLDTREGFWRLFHLLFGEE